MNRDIVKGMYIASEGICSNMGRSEAWLWEETFASLFVKECMAVADKAVKNGLVPSEEIAKHFGVE
jgi:hypothetical protein